MSELTEQDVPTLRHLAEFFADRKGTRGFAGAILCKALSDLCIRIVVSIGRNGRISSGDTFDSVGRIKPKVRR